MQIKTVDVALHDSQDEQSKKRLAGPSPGKGAKKEPKVAACSCLDGLWEAVKAGARLRAQQPAVLAHALRAMLAMWQVHFSAPCMPPTLHHLLHANRNSHCAYTCKPGNG